MAQPVVNTTVNGNLTISSLERGKIHHLWMTVGTDAFDRSIDIPIIVIRGQQDGKVLGITAAIHGNEVNGIGAIHELVMNLDPSELSGTVVAVPGLNPSAIFRYQREHEDVTDVNRIFPGSDKGNESERLADFITKQFLPQIAFLIDLHTASFGRSNSLYARLDAQNATLQGMLDILDADILLNSQGGASTSQAAASARTLRTQASMMNIDCVTIELGNPQVYQSDMIMRGVRNMHHIMSYLGMWDRPVAQDLSAPVRCRNSYWVYTDRGGFLTMEVNLLDRINEGQLIATLRNAFGQITKQYHSPESGIVIGQSTNPVNNAGGRIIHLGIIE